MTSSAATFDPHPYAPHRIGAWLKEWPALDSAAETPETSRHLWTWEHRNQDGACEREQRLDQGKRYHGDPMSGADVRADLEQAIALLPAYSLESMVVAKVVAAACGDWSVERRLSAIAKQLGRRYSDVREAYSSALEMMARSLGWEEEP